MSKKIIFGVVEVRMAMQVANVIAEDIENPKGGVGIRPVLLSISGTTFRYEGGIVIKIEMFCKKNDGPFNEWLVVSAESKSYPADSSSRDIRSKQIKKWGEEELKELKNRRHWWHPNVATRDDLLDDD